MTIGRGGNGKRKFKVEKRKRMELEGVTSSIMAMLRRHGYPVVVPNDVPGIIRQLLSAQKGEPLPPQVHAQPQVIALQPDSMRPARPMQAEVTLTATVQLHAPQSVGWDFETPEEEPLKVNATSQIEFDGGVPEDMIDSYKNKTAEMIGRVETQGVNYRHSPGPAQGQRMTVAPDAAKRLGVPESPTFSDPEDSEFDDSRGSGGRVNPHTGMSREEQARIIQRVTGKRPEAPQGGRLNTMK